MAQFPLLTPSQDPAPIFEAFRGNHGTELLCCAVTHLGVFPLLAETPLTIADLASRLGLSARAGVVLTTALQAMGLLSRDGAGRLTLTPLARAHLLPTSPHDVSAYIGLGAESPGVRGMLDSLRSSKPAGTEPDDEGAAFIYREGLDSAMEKESVARRLTLSLAGRARNVAPVLAAVHPLERASCLLDVGGGSGLYAIAYLERHPHLRAIVWDRPEVLKVAAEFAADARVADRLTCQPGDMFRDPVPSGCDVVLLSNILHDWDVPECRTLVTRCAAALPKGGELVVHDVFLNDALDGPLPIALYSAALFVMTEGRAYSAQEYREWMTEAGLVPEAVAPTLVHCGVLPGRRA